MYILIPPVLKYVFNLIGVTVARNKNNNFKILDPFKILNITNE